MAQKRQIYVTEFDLQRLQDHLDNLDVKTRKQFQSLDHELSRAKVVDSAKVPASVVTMNSRLAYRDLEEDTVSEITLVFPDQADLDQGKMSVFSPIGTALLGYAVGDVIEWTVPAGTRKLKIEDLLYQPEAAGDLNL
ncbi:MAG: nucleoside diphosphate kinase regulator [Verrucomicrobia bacterium]|nr:nucleoside diphosphate kinase regulator [Verrucomicrobiota bacterium]MCH8528299.1 nucleoside diphosphate kinase regulator [Kiritimatiellia bacterium]